MTERYTVVPKTPTTLSDRQIARDIYDGLKARGGPMQPDLLASLSMLSGIETAHGSAQNNHNYGNFHAADNYSGNAFRPSWYTVTDQSSDQMKALHTRMLSGDAPKAFRAYASPGDGVSDFLHVLLDSDERYPPLIEAMKGGDPDEFIQALHDTGYSRDYVVSKHHNTFVGLQARYRPLAYELIPPMNTPEDLPEPLVPMHLQNAPDGGLIIALGMGGALVGSIWLSARIIKDVRDLRKKPA